MTRGDQITRQLSFKAIGPGLVERICWVVMVPIAVVSAFLVVTM